FLDFRIGNRLAATRFIQVPALAGLLPEAAALGDLVGDLRVLEVRTLDIAALADLPADVEAGHVAHRERPHREAPLLRRGVDLLRRAAFVDQEHRLLPVFLDHAVADEAVADTRDDR